MYNLIKAPIPFTDVCLMIKTSVKRDEINDFILNTVSDWHNINQNLKNLKNKTKEATTSTEIRRFYFRAIASGYKTDSASYVVELLKKKYPSIEVSIINREVM